MGSIRSAVAVAGLMIMALTGCSALSVPAPPPTSVPVGSPTAEEVSPVPDLAPCLIGEWLHSHEDDDGQDEVYRPSSAAFPPARGRTGYTFDADGGLTYRGIAATDGSTTTAGRWTLDGDRLEVTIDGAGGQTRRIVSCDPGRLVLRPVS